MLGHVYLAYSLRLYIFLLFYRSSNAYALPVGLNQNTFHQSETLQVYVLSNSIFETGFLLVALSDAMRLHLNYTL